MVRKFPVELIRVGGVERLLLSTPTRRGWTSRRLSTIRATMIFPSIMTSLSSKSQDHLIAQKEKSGQLAYPVLRLQRYLEI